MTRAVAQTAINDAGDGLADGVAIWTAGTLCQVLSIGRHYSYKSSSNHWTVSEFGQKSGQSKPAPG